MTRLFTLCGIGSCPGIRKRDDGGIDLITEDSEIPVSREGAGMLKEFLEKPTTTKVVLCSIGPCPTAVREGDKIIISEKGVTITLTPDMIDALKQHIST